MLIRNPGQNYKLRKFSLCLNNNLNKFRFTLIKYRWIFMKRLLDLIKIRNKMKQINKKKILSET